MRIRLGFSRIPIWEWEPDENSAAFHPEYVLIKAQVSAETGKDPAGSSLGFKPWASNPGVCRFCSSRKSRVLGFLLRNVPRTAGACVRCKGRDRTSTLCINLLNCQSDKLGGKPSAGSSAGSIPQERQEQQFGVQGTRAGVFGERSWCGGAGCRHPGGWPARWAGASACCRQPHLLLQRSQMFACALRLSKAGGMLTCSVAPRCKECAAGPTP